MSLPQPVDGRCEVTSTNNPINIHKKQKDIIQGKQDPIIRMWTVPFTIDDDPPDTALHTIDAILNCNVIVHDRDHTSWGSQGTWGRYITCAEDHYQNHECLMKKTGAIKISNAVEFFPHQITMPETSTEDCLSAVLNNLKTILAKPHWKLPLLIKGSKTNDALEN